MTNKIWDGSAWKEYKNLKVWDGSNWKNALRGWLWNGSNWRQFYPEYPVNITAPTISGSSIQGNILTVTDGTWKGFANNDIAFTYNQTAYQWLRNGSDISGANGNQYATVSADVGTSITCRVTVTNNRGPTPATSSNSINVQQALPGSPSNLSVTSSTITPGFFSVSSSSNPPSSPSISMGSNSNVTSSTGQINWSSSNQRIWSSSGTFGGSGTSETSIYRSTLSANSTYTGTVTVTGPEATNATGSWTQPTNFSYYTYSTNIGALSADSNARTFTLTTGAGTGGSFYVVNVTAWNPSGRATISWTAGNNATSYDIYINGSYWTNTTSTSIVYNWGTTGNLTVNVRSRNAQGVESTGVTATGTINQAGLTAQTSGYISSGNTASASYSLSTPSPQVTPSINSFSITWSDTARTLMTAEWTSTNQSSYSLSVSPSTGGGAGGSSWSGSTQTSRYMGVGTAGTTYTATLTITSSTGHQTSAQTTHFVPSGGGSSTPSAPGTPTLTYVSANNTDTTWGYSATWPASSGSGTIQYQIDALGNAGGTGTLGLYSTNSATFNLSKNSNLWQIRVRATNNSGSTWSSYSGYSNSA